jgi:glutamate racemase
LGVIRPTTEIIGDFTKTDNVGILATNGTVQSNSYPVEIKKFFPEINVVQQACPMWVPLIENNEHNSEGADYFVKEYTDALMQKCNSIDTVLLACTHYPLLKEKIIKSLPAGISIISQGEIVANSFMDYLKRHPEMENRISKNGLIDFFTTDSTEDFDNHATIFYGGNSRSKHAEL